MSDIAETRKELQNWMTNDRVGCILGAAAELNFFAYLAKTPQTAQDMAKNTESDIRATTFLLDALAAIGFLTKNMQADPAVYSISEKFLPLLSPDDPQTFVPMLLHHMNYIRKWTQLARVAKSGKPWELEESIRGREADYQSFILAMNSVAIALAEPTVARLQEAGLLHFKHLLDIGGASGTYTRAFLKIMPNIKATLFDLPPAVEEARKKFAGTDYENRVTLVPGNFYTDPLPKGADFAWISAIIHQFDRAHSVELYRKTFDALESGGMIAVRDHVLNTDRISPVEGVLFAVNMLAGTETGMCYTLDEIREDLETAGFKDVKLAIATNDMSSVVTAVKK